MSEASRPWYLSLTAKWCEAENFCELEREIDRLLVDCPLPFHHFRLPPEFCHSTIYAVLKVEVKRPDPKDTFSLSDIAVDLFGRLGTVKPCVEERVCKALPLLFQPSELRCFDSETTIQFAPLRRLKDLRDDLRQCMEPVQGIIHAFQTPRVCVTNLCNQDKSKGPNVYGSIARSTSRSDCDALRWSLPFRSIQPLSFRTIQLLVSDDALTNHHDSTNSLRISVP